MSALKVEAVLFDFDGTVIDSYPGIQQAFDEAFLLTYSVTNNISIQSHIGPPIDKILTNVTGETHPEKISSFVTFFKNKYDTEAFKASLLYDGMKELLEQLFQSQIKLYIVTNKREKATKIITAYLEIDKFFSGFYCSDTKEQYSSKAGIVKDLLEVERLDTKNCLFIGDTIQDELAAKENNIPFVYADYGYGNLEEVGHSVKSPLEILNFINK